MRRITGVKGIITSYNKVFAQGCTWAQSQGNVYHIPLPGAKLHRGGYLLGTVQGRHKYGNIRGHGDIGAVPRGSFEENKDLNNGRKM